VTYGRKKFYNIGLSVALVAQDLRSPVSGLPVAVENSEAGAGKPGRAGVVDVIKLFSFVTDNEAQ
jgi:hypothetical protein